MPKQKTREFPLDQSEKEIIFSYYLRGVPIDHIARQFRVEMRRIIRVIEEKKSNARERKSSD